MKLLDMCMFWVIEDFIYVLVKKKPTRNVSSKMLKHVGQIYGTVILISTILKIN